MSKLKDKDLGLDGSLFQREKTTKYLKKVDNTFERGFKPLTLEFKIHSLPMVGKSEMDKLLKEAPTIFGGTWSHLMSLCGYSDKTKLGARQGVSQLKNLDTKRRDVFPDAFHGKGQ